MTNKKYEYIISDKNGDNVLLKMKKLTIGASIKFDKVLNKGLDDENFSDMMEAMFPNQGTEKIDWLNLEDGIEIWTKIQKDFFFVNKSLLDGQKSLVKDILSGVAEPNTPVTSKKNTG